MTPEALDSFGKKELITIILAQAETINALRARIEELEEKLGLPPKTPDNSSKPPSSGQKANTPKKKKKPRRKGRAGVTRNLAASPDKVRDIFARACYASPRTCPFPHGSSLLRGQTGHLSTDRCSVHPQSGRPEQASFVQCIGQLIGFSLVLLLRTSHSDSPKAGLLLELRF